MKKQKCTCATPFGTRMIVKEMPCPIHNPPQTYIGTPTTTSTGTYFPPQKECICIYDGLRRIDKGICPKHDLDNERIKKENQPPQKEGWEGGESIEGFEYKELIDIVVDGFTGKTKTEEATKKLLDWFSDYDTGLLATERQKVEEMIEHWLFPNKKVGQVWSAEKHIDDWNNLRTTQGGKVK